MDLQQGDITFDLAKKMTEELLSYRLETLDQLDSIKDKNIRAALLRFFRETTRYDREHLGEVTLSQIMDIYAFARMLREFSMEKKSKQFAGTSENVIFYAGEFHIQNLKIFFEDYLHIQPFYHERVTPKFPYYDPRTFHSVQFYPPFIGIDAARAGMI
jgi:hypothetical protein